MKYMPKAVMTALVVLPLIYACGKGSSGDGKEASQRQDATDEGTVDGSTIDGLYMAKFETLNPHVNGTLPGSLTFFRTGDKVITYLRLFAGKPKAWHQQGIYMGKRCPNLSDDKNGDGFIDIDEFMAVAGQMIIPLDSNLNSQAAGRNFYPLGDLSGYYHYERVSSFNSMMNDLRQPDKDPNDHIAKLAPDQKFTVEGKVVLVQGVSEDTILPESVVGLERRRNFQTLPIACGIIKKVTTTPGTPDNEVVPGPVADVIPGQDHPADPADLPGATGGTVAGTTGSNDNHDGDMGDAGGTEGGTSGGSTSGGTHTGGGSTTSGTTGRTAGGFIGGFIGGSSGGRGSTGGVTTGGTHGRTAGGFIGGFIGGSSGGRGTTGGSTTGESTTGGSTTGESDSGSTTGGSGDDDDR